MKAFITSTVFTLALVGSIQFAQAEEMTHAEMESTMQECMKMNKDQKECHQESMKSCESKMGKKECAKMMKNMKHMKMDHK